jgi:NAD(P)-dependent dehydrogenase (short-subunit alcohol dehydrogenase family)
MENTGMSLAGRTAVVIGGTTGIGRALALGLAKAGADVVASARRESEVDSIAAEIEALGRKTLRQCSDVCDLPSLTALRDGVLSAFGKVDILVNSAGITKRAPSVDYPEADWDRIIEVNLKGTLRGCQIFGKPMLERCYGRIINIASVSTYVGLMEVAAYGASKAAVGSLTKSLSVEWSRHGVNVNAIAPGFFKTALTAKLLENTPRGNEIKMRTPIGRFGQVDELQGACVFLASDAASFVTGEILTVDGGFLSSGVNQ